MAESRGMKWITFQMTADLVRSGKKTVTRRNGWERLRPGDRLVACERRPTVKCRRCDGSGRLPPLDGALFAVSDACGACDGRGVVDQDPRSFGEIEVVSVGREPLDCISREECAAEGFRHMDPRSFVDLFIRSHPGVTQRWHVITRIEFIFHGDSQIISG